MASCQISPEELGAHLRLKSRARSKDTVRGLDGAGQGLFRASICPPYRSCPHRSRFGATGALRPTESLQ